MNVITKTVFELDEGGKPNQIYERGEIVELGAFGQICYREGEFPPPRPNWAYYDENGHFIPDDCATASMGGELEGLLWMVIDVPKTLAAGDRVTLVHLSTNSTCVLPWEELAASTTIDSRGNDVGGEPLPTDPESFLKALNSALFVPAEAGRPAKFGRITTFIF